MGNKSLMNLLKNKRKIMIVLFLIILVILLVFVFVKIYYKNQNFGNNMTNKSIEEIEKYILNISSYEAKMEVTVKSNKNTNKYLIEQIYEKNNTSKQKILEPSNIKGVEIKYENNTLTITNSKLNLITVYDNYSYLVENYLWIDAFIEDYKSGKNNGSAIISEENNLITLETKTRNENNQYVYYKKLIIDKKNGKPTKLLVQDINKKNLIYILYNEITVNGLQ